MDKPQPWAPYSGDCSQGLCSYYCPQWCFFLFPPPPPPSPSRPLLSPLLIAVIAVVSTAFLLAAYYLILTHYRRQRRTRASGLASHPDHPLAAWHAARTDGLDETLINRIAACQYRAGGGLIVDGTDCSVCLSQFEDGDCIRLLPKCGHAFHVDCIDTWLKAHSSCPLCRAGIFPLPTNSIGPTNNGSTVAMDRRSESELSAGESESDITIENPTSRGTTDVVSHEIIEIRECRPGVIGRSLSMDSSLRRQSDSAGPSRWGRTLQSVLISPIQMKRSRSLTSSTLPP